MFSATSRKRGSNLVCYVLAIFLANSIMLCSSMKVGVDSFSNFDTIVSDANGNQIKPDLKPVDPTSDLGQRIKQFLKDNPHPRKSEIERQRAEERKWGEFTNAMSNEETSLSSPLTTKLESAERPDTIKNTASPTFELEPLSNVVSFTPGVNENHNQVGPDFKQMKLAPKEGKNKINKLIQIKSCTRAKLKLSDNRKKLKNTLTPRSKRNYHVQF